jgi:hypothetical protein
MRAKKRRTSSGDDFFSKQHYGYLRKVPGDSNDVVLIHQKTCGHWAGD